VIELDELTRAAASPTISYEGALPRVPLIDLSRDLGRRGSRAGLWCPFRDSCRGYHFTRRRVLRDRCFRRVRTDTR